MTTTALRLRQFTRWSILLMVLWAGVAIALAIGTLWNQVRAVPLDLNLPLIVAVLACATISCLLRGLRWHLLEQRMAPGIPFRTSLRHFLIGFGLTVTPGKAVEVIKLYRLREERGIPIARTMPALAVEKVSEGLAFGLLAAGSSLALPALRQQIAAYRWPLLGFALLARPLLGRLIQSKLERGPAWWRTQSRQAAAGGMLVLGVRPLVVSTGLGVLGRVMDSLALVLLAWHLGVMLPPAGGLFILGTSGLTGGLSLVPGGLGVVELNQAGLLVMWGASTSQAILVTLLVRMATFWLWVSLGLGIILRMERTVLWKERA
jgi:uncharacterized membrane protein YbhN (UPF0104 family)